MAWVTWGDQFSRAVVALVVGLSLAGCASLRRNTGEHSPGASPDAQGSEATQVAPKEPLLSGARPAQERWGVVLGPGGVKTLAHAGVLRELQRARVPIAAILGLEWGALVAALYADKAEAHQVDWQLYKFEQRGWPESGWLNKRPKPADAVALVDSFVAAMGTTRLENFKLAYACPARRLSSGRVSWQLSGEVSKALSSCLRYPPTGELKGAWVAAPGAAREAAQRARLMGAERVLFVNVLGAKNIDEMATAGGGREEDLERLLWSQVRDAVEGSRDAFDAWIDVDTSGYDAFALGRRNDLESLGETAARRVLPSVRQK